ncbi:NAD-dependent epimerase/dehydratase family protein [Vulcanisaeta souniana]|uniref:NAD-dependent dehydratase n=1 Tax=Vulcanisaeta souniana JCM 11219 TaxID=1293586 RepID=A0A830E4X4_9CREN|nr:SDR family oxidoreductase [Vulcanisaeta souniana]BDR91642.1 NAD-dependent dehydratase [Vulcanisaeta souniana JCM 11219]GGI71664.1 NAD-dependent dehydratase [Vulcanisaeta souniana JCM 11219]
MKVLVTGCGGYIGTLLTPYLLRKGYGVRCVDRLFFGDDVLKHVIGERNFELVKADTRSISKDVLNGIDAVVDLAALSNDPAGELNPQWTLDINYRARARLAKLASEVGVSRYILASSCSVYGRQSGIADENTEPNPLTTYAKANLLAEKDALSLASNRFTVTALRFATVYGPSIRMRFDLVINAMTLSAFTEGVIYVEGDGMQERPLVHVMDVVRAINTVLETPSDRVNGMVFNVGSDEQNFRVIDMARIVQGIVGGEVRFRGMVDARSYRVSFKRIREVLNFSVLYNVDDGVKQVYHELLTGHLRPEDRWFTVRWYKKLLEQNPKLLDSY